MLWDGSATDWWLMNKYDDRKPAGIKTITLCEKINFDTRLGEKSQ